MSYIELENVSKKYKELEVLKDISLKIPKGSITTFEGVNGSGKTLLLKAILGLIRTSGTIKVNHQIVNVEDKYPVMAGILIENPSILPFLSGFQNMKLLAELIPNFNHDEINQLLAQFGLLQAKDQQTKKYSLGMKQKLGIAQAFIGYPPLIVLDEPTNALDEESLANLITFIKQVNQEKQTTFLIASHDKAFIKSLSTNRVKVKEGHTYEEMY